MKRYSICFLVAAMCCCTVITAQTVDTEVRLLQLKSANECAPSAGLTLPGNAEFGFGWRSGDCRETEENLIQLRQVGDDNAVQLDIAAENVEVRALQYGDRQDFDADIRRDGVKDWVVQRGHDNTLNHVLAVDGVWLETYQVGHGLELTQIETGGGFPRYIITQTGADMSVIITNGGIR